MNFLRKFMPASAALAAACLLSWAVAIAAEPGSITDDTGAPPGTELVERPQDALRLWHDMGIKNRPLLLVSEDLPIYRLEEDDVKWVLSEIAKGRLDAVMGRGFDTPFYYPVNRSSFLHIAHKAGYLSRIYWVPPTKEAVGSESSGNLYSYFSAMRVPEDELKSLEWCEKSISGNLNGIPVYICNLRDIPKTDSGLVLLVDLNFFGPLYQDEVRTPFLDLFGSFMQALAASRVKVSDALVSYSTSDGTVPLERRFIGGYLEEFLSMPQKIAGGPPRTWKLRSQAMYHETFFQVDEALKAYQDAVDISPKDASLRFDLALSYFSLKNVDRMKEELDRAVSLDKGYYPAYITYGRYFATKGLMPAAEDFIEEAVRAEPDDPEVWRARHDIMRASGKYEEAVHSQNRFIALGYNGAEPLFGLAQDYASLGEHSQAIENYLQSLKMLPLPDTTLRPQVLLGLAESYEKTGRIQESLDAYEDALAVTADQHSWMRINERYKALKKKWAPFMKSVEGGGDG